MKDVLSTTLRALAPMFFGLFVTACPTDTVDHSPRDVASADQLAPNVDSGPLTGCMTQIDCDPGESCYFPDGLCARGVCEAGRSCLSDASLSDTDPGFVYCDCRGQTVTPGPCITVPWHSRGPCSTTDAQLGLDTPAFDTGSTTFDSGTGSDSSSPMDAAVSGGACMTQSDCLGNETCYFPNGACAPGVCEANRSCLPDAARPDGDPGFVYCDCSGNTISPGPCVTVPWQRRGPC